MKFIDSNTKVFIAINTANCIVFIILSTSGTLETSYYSNIRGKISTESFFYESPSLYMAVMDSFGVYKFDLTAPLADPISSLWSLSFSSG